MEGIELLMTISAICSALIPISTVLLAISKKPKEWLKKWILKINKEQLDEQLKPLNDKLNQLIAKAEKSTEVEKARLGHGIMTIYDRSMLRGYITLADKKDLVELYKTYKDNNGNHHVDDYYDILMDMKTE